MSAKADAAKRRRADGRGQPGAVVIGSDYIALGVVRSLGRRGIPVWLLHDDRHMDAVVSRHVHRRLPWPIGDTARLTRLLELYSRHDLGGWTLYPADDEAAALVARHHRALSERFLLTTPPWDVLRWAYDKRLTYALAARLSIDHPWTYCPRSGEIAALECDFPVILKPAVKPQINRFTLARAWRVDDRSQLLRRYAEARELVSPDEVMIQELIPGGGRTQFSFAALCASGRPLAWLVARRTRQYPIEFSRGSTFVETMDEPAIEEPARRLLAEIGYTGLVEVEFKRDPRTGCPRLLDINARTWGWHTLGRRAGADFPFLSWRLARGETIPETRARPGVRWVRAIVDVPAALSEMRRGQLSLSAYLRSLRPPLECAVFASDDPLPSLVDVPAFLYRRLRSIADLRSRRCTQPAASDDSRVEM
jgi:predicted ATP-grasp superfamily ATP-dependent carboligase